MTRDLLKTVLESRDEFDPDGAAFVANAETTVDVFYATGASPVAIARVSRIDMSADYVAIETETATYCLAYDDIVGLKLNHRKEAGLRTGFRQ